MGQPDREGCRVLVPSQSVKLMWHHFMGVDRNYRDVMMSLR